MESNSPNRFDEILNEKLANASLDASGIGWDDFQNKKSKKRGVWWWFPAAALVIAILWVSIRPVQNTQKSNAQILKNTSGNAASIQKNKTINNGRGLVVLDKFQKNTIKKNKENSTAIVPDLIPEEEQISSVEVPKYTYEPDKPFESKEQIAARIFKQIDSTTRSDVGPDNHSDANSDGNMVQNPDLNRDPIADTKTNPDAIKHDKTDKDKFKIKGLYFQFQAGANLNYPKFLVTNYGSQFIHKNYESIRKNSEKGLWGYSLQLGAGKEMGKFALETGLGFTFMEIAADYKFSYSEKPIRDIDGKIVGYNNTTPEWIQFQNTHKYYFADIPLMLKYTIFDSPKNVIRLKAGGMAQIMNGIRGMLPDPVLLDQRDNLRSENFKSFSAALDLGMEYCWKKGDKSQWIIAPYYRKNLGLDQVQSLYKMRFNYYGIALSYRKSL